MSRTTSNEDVTTDDEDLDSTETSSFTDLDDDEEEDIDPRIIDLINIQAKPFQNEPDLSLDDGSPFPPTNLVLRISSRTHPSAITFLANKIAASKRNSGAELLLRCEPFSENQDIHLHVSAKTTRFLEVAEFMELKKIDDCGKLREFHVSDLDSFIHSDITLETLLTSAEKERIILKELKGIKALPGEANIPGYPGLVLHSGQPIFHNYILYNIITTHYPLHDEEQLNKLLKTNWIQAFFAQEPFEELRSYFGEGIALNFIFTGFYTVYLIFPAMISIILSILPNSIMNSNMEICLFSVINLIFIAILFKLWRRKCSELAYAWGTRKMMALCDESRLRFRGQMGFNSVTGQYQPKYNSWKRWTKVWCVSFPLVLLSMWGAYLVMLLYFRADRIMKMRYKERYKNTFLGFVCNLTPSTIYGICVSIMTILYRDIANLLTEWENHRTQTQHEKYRVAKLVAFESVNNFMALFYVAFVLKRFADLKRQLIVMLLIMHLLVALNDIVIPLLLREASKNLKKFLHRHDETPQPKPVEKSKEKSSRRKSLSYSPESFGLTPLSPDDPRIEMNSFEGKMDPYQGCYDDYSALFVQFGYIFLFSPIFPFASCIALVTNLFLIHANIYKLCAVFQRPIPVRVKNMGAWQTAFEFLGVLAIFSNVSLLAFSLELKEKARMSGWTYASFISVVIFIEHVLIAVFFIINKIVSDAPRWVRIAETREEYLAREMFKREQSTKTRRRLTLHYQMINTTLQDGAGANHN